MCLNSHEAPEAPPAAAEEGVSDGFTDSAVLAGVGNTHRHLHLTPAAGVLGVTAARKP